MHRRQHGMRVHMCLGGLEDSVHWFLPSFGGMHEARVGEAVDPSLVCASAVLFWGVFGVRCFLEKGVELPYLFLARS